MTNTHTPTPIEHALELASDARRLVQRLRGHLVAADLDSARQRLQSTGTAAVQALDAELADLQADDRRRAIS